MNSNWKSLLDQLDALILRDFGEPCDGYEPLCASCFMRRQRDEIASVIGACSDDDPADSVSVGRRLIRAARQARFGFVRTFGKVDERTP